MKKLTVIFLTALLIAAAAFGFSGCNGKTVPVEGIKMVSNRIVNTNNMYIVNGSFHQLDYKLLPEGAKLPKGESVEWVSSEPAAARLNQDGLLKGRKIQDVTITVKYKEFSFDVILHIMEGVLVPDSSSASSTQPNTVSDRAFDRETATYWKSNAASYAVQGTGTEWLQAEYKYAREVKKIEVLFHSSSYMATGKSFKIYGSDDINFGYYVQLAEIQYGDIVNADGINTASVAFTETAVYKNYRFEFPRSTLSNDTAIAEIYLYAPDTVTKP